VHDPRFSADDTAKVLEAFGAELPPEFIAFRKLLPFYNVTGDHLPADEMTATYDWEAANNPNFTEDFIPFYAVGNGDFLCLSKPAGRTSPVLYVAHDDPEVAVLHPSFSDYLRDAEWYSEH
ncbi:SMI1/KNR4 family protein, partial [Luteolibacter pohnpeiensis]